MSLPDATTSQDSPDADGVTSETPAADPSLARHLDGLVDTLLANVAEALASGSEESVHVSRVTTRRLKAATELLHPIFPEKKRQQFDKVTRRIRRKLGAARDADVMIGHLRDIGDDDARHRPAGGWLSARLAAERDEALNAARADKIVPRITTKIRPWIRLREQLLVNSEVVDALLADSLHDGLTDFASRADQIAAARDDRTNTIDPHAVRIAGKGLRYTVEVAQAHGVELGDKVTKSFKQMQDALGLWHDHVVLCERATQLSAQGMLAHHDSQLQRGVLALAGVALDEADRQLAKFVTLWRDRGAELLETVRTALPPKESRTDRDPAGSEEPAASDGSP